MTGVVRARDVLLHVPTVVRYYGWSVLWRCTLSGLRGDRQTFLEIAVTLRTREKTSGPSDAK